MRRSVRYLLAVVIAGAVTVGVGTVHESTIIRLGTFVTYAMAATLSLSYPSLLGLRRPPDGAPDLVVGVVLGGLTFGIVTLGQVAGEPIHIGATVLATGLVWFGLVAGVWMVDTGEVSLHSAETDTSDSSEAVRTK